MSTRTLPDHPNLDQLRRQAKELHKAAAAGEADAIERLAPVAKDVSLNTAQLALAREYGFASWPRLKNEVERRQLIETGDAAGLAELLASDPTLATEEMTSPIGEGRIPPLQYVGIGLLHGVWDHHRAGELTKVLLAAGVPVDQSTDSETWLITAASHGEPEMARVLIEAGADLEASGRAAPGSSTALAHAVHYGIVEAVDLLVEAGAVIHDLVEAAGVGDIAGYRLGTVGRTELVHALRAAAVCERLKVIDQLLETGLDVNSQLTTLTEVDGTALHCAAWEGKDRSVAHLLAAGADPNLTVAWSRTPRGVTALDVCRWRSGVGHGGNHAAVEAILVPVTV